MKVLAVRLPEKSWAYEIFRAPNSDTVLSVHGDGTLHLFRDDLEYIIKPDMKNLKICCVSKKGVNFES